MLLTNNADLLMAFRELSKHNKEQFKCFSVCKKEEQVFRKAGQWCCSNSSVEKQFLKKKMVVAQNSSLQ